MSSEKNDSVCENQTKFNKAFKKAVNYTADKQKVPLWAQILSFIILVVIFLWALILASKENGQKDKVLHYILALLFAPIYIMAYYIDAIQKK